MSIRKEIERLQQAKKDIGDAIVRKGGSVSGTIDTYANSVMALGDVSFRTAIDIVNKSDARYYEKQATDTLLDEKVDKTDIVQTTGTSTTSVMSQKAVTDIIGNVEQLLKNI